MFGFICSRNAWPEKLKHQQGVAGVGKTFYINLIGSRAVIPTAPNQTLSGYPCSSRCFFGQQGRKGTCGQCWPARFGKHFLTNKLKQRKAGRFPVKGHDGFTALRFGGMSNQQIRKIVFALLRGLDEMMQSWPMFKVQHRHQEQIPQRIYYLMPRYCID